MKSVDDYTNDGELLESMFNHATVGIVMVGHSGRIIRANTLANQIFGYVDGELIGESIEILVPSGAHHRHQKYRDEYFKDPQPRTMGSGRELYGIKKDGSQFAVEISLSYAHQKGQQVAIAFVNDISIRKSMILSLNENKQQLQEYSDRLEQKVIERTQELTDSENRLREAQRMASLGYWEFDLTSKVLSTSEVLQTIFEIRNQEDVDAETFIALIHPEDSSLADEVVRKVIISGQRREYSYRILTRGGKVKYIQGYLEREVDRENGIVKIFGITQDITAFKAAEKQLEVTLQKEIELGELKSRFVAMASHEFRTPLTAILSSVDLIEIYADRLGLGKFDRHVGRIKSSVNNLTAILNDFLSLEKLESGKVELQLQEHNIPGLLNKVIEEMHLSKADRARIQVTHLGGEMAIVDEKLMRNILFNLISNAVKYAAGESPIELSAERRSDALLLSVTDHGIGIPENDQRNLFNRFFRASNAESIKGTGLGLNIVKQYTDIMGGEISFQSKEGVGTSFKVKLPQ